MSPPHNVLAPGRPGGGDARGAGVHPPADRPWSLETYGIARVAEEDRHGRAIDLLWVWLAANLGIVAVVYGAIVASLGLDLGQACVVAVVGAVGSFVPVGLLGVGGQQWGEPMLALSRRVFGNTGNRGPALLSWVSLVGWETITAVVATNAVLALLPARVESGPRAAVAVAVLGVIIGCSLVASRLGHATIVVVQRLTAWLFGLATVVLVADLAWRGDWSASASAHPAPFTAVLAACSIVAASGGISWVNVSADYSRYLPRHEPPRAVVGWTVLGASLPFSVLVVVGFVLAGTFTRMASTANPIDAVRTILPGWAGAPFLVVALAGLLAQMVMGLYSSGLSLLALGIRVRRSRTVLIDAVVVMGFGVWITVVPNAFLGTLTSVVELLACPIAAWAAVFLAHMALARRASSTQRPPRRSARVASAAWLAGTVIGLACTSSPLFDGPLAKGVFAGSSLGYFAGAFVAGTAFVLFSGGALSAQGFRRGG